jgi:hypothetical protein
MYDGEYEGFRVFCNTESRFQVREKCYNVLYAKNILYVKFFSVFGEYAKRIFQNYPNMPRDI